jgi:molecular chaperone Hsp33
MKQIDQILRFIINNSPIRGQLVRLDNSWQQCRKNLDADDFAQKLLGQALSAVTLLASTLKLQGHITLQIRGQGAIHLLVAQATSEKTIRGLVRQNSTVKDESAPLAEIFQADKMVITIDNGKGKPYQGVVPLIGNSIEKALDAYFEHSEQLPTRLWFSSNSETCAGLLLQKMPGEIIDEDAWQRVIQLASTLSEEELLNLPSEEILFRLFHEESVQLFDPETIEFDCNCSIQRTAEVIKALGHQEALAILKEQGSIHINCEFCNADYYFDSIDIEQLFNPSADLDFNQTIH